MRCIGKCGLLFVVLLAACFTLTVLSYTLPAEKMQEHALDAAETLAAEGYYPHLQETDMSYQLDNFTDALMLGTAAYPSTYSPVVAAMLSERPDCESVTIKPLLLLGGG